VALRPRLRCRSASAAPKLVPALREAKSRPRERAAPDSWFTRGNPSSGSCNSNSNGEHIPDLLPAPSKHGDCPAPERL